MQKMYLTLLLLLGISVVSYTQDQQKEILLMGTMHLVPKIAKKSYKPLYKIAKDYAPEAIYVEVAMPDDSLSWAYLKNGYSASSRWFYQYADSLQQVHTYEQQEIDELLEKALPEMTPADIETLQLYFASRRDSPNYRYYRYLQKYGLQGRQDLSREENNDLSYKLALALGHRQLYATDDQQTNREFHEAWYQCEQEIAGTEYEKAGNRLVRKLTRRAIGPILLGRYGHITNHPKDLRLTEELSSLAYANQEVESCAQALDYFQQRNHRIVANLGSQITEKSKEKSILIIGAAHIVGVKAELQSQFPDIKVLTLEDL